MIALVFAAMLQTAAPVEPRVIARPNWLRPNNPSNPLRYYPEDAQRRGTEGAATMSCTVDGAGFLRDCRVLAETPQGAGFGDAAINMSVLFRMSPVDKDGQRVEGATVQVPIRFQLPR